MGAMVTFKDARVLVLKPKPWLSTEVLETQADPRQNRKNAQKSKCVWLSSGQQMDTLERLMDKSAPAGLEAVGLGVSDQGLEGHVAQRRHVSGQALQQDLQAGQDSVAQLTRLQRRALQQKVEELASLQHANLKANQHQTSASSGVLFYVFFFLPIKASTFCSLFHLNNPGFVKGDTL